MKYSAGDFIPAHKHPGEQSGYILSGIYILGLDDLDEILTKGDYYTIPANAEYSIEVLEGGEVITVLFA
jgi:quercetin dioxygenase-like cupin family protein